MTTWPSNFAASSSPRNFAVHAPSRPPRKKAGPSSQPGPQPGLDQQNCETRGHGTPVAAVRSPGCATAARPTPRIAGSGTGPDQLLHQFAGPQRELQLILPRVRALDQHIQRAQLRTRQFPRPPRHRLGSQCLLSTFTVGSHPAEHRRAGQPQRRRHILYPRPGLDPLHRADPHRFQRGVVELPAIVFPHPEIIPDPKVQVQIRTI